LPLAFFIARPAVRFRYVAAFGFIFGLAWRWGYTAGPPRRTARHAVSERSDLALNVGKPRDNVPVRVHRTHAARQRIQDRPSAVSSNASPAFKQTPLKNTILKR
jgi:hypothetical protein